MNFERVVEAFKAKVLSCGLATITTDIIALPNAVFSHAGKDLWIELNVSPQGTRQDTEDEVVTTCCCNVVVCVPENTGTARANNVAERVSRAFHENDTRSEFDVSGGRVVTRRVEQLPSISVNDVLKTNVRVIFDLYYERV